MAHTTLNPRIAPLALLLVALGTFLFVLSPSHNTGVSSIVDSASHGGLRKRFFGGHSEREIVKKAVVYIKPDPASPLAINGTITFTQDECEGPTRIFGTITGLEPNVERGMHIHAYGVNLPSCTAAGPHFNPYNVTHGAPTNDKAHRHVGDLGNVKSDAQGVVNIDITDKLISLNGERSVIGRAIVLHANTDDLGLGGNEESLKTGNAGARSGCGIIGISAPA